MSDDEDFVLSDAMSEGDFENDDADAEEEAALQRALLESKKMEAAAAKKRKKSSVVTDEKEATAFGREIPFGPYLALATILYVVFLKEWIDPWFVKSFFFNDLS